MANVPAINGNQLQPRQQRRAKPSKEFGYSQGSVEVQTSQSGGLAREDSVELSPEAMEVLRQSRLRAKE